MPQPSRVDRVAAPARRSQAERRATTRARLLDATVDCLAERGYARTTTAEVAARAGVSRGAQVHHFPTRADLVASAVEHVFERLQAEFAAAVGVLPEGPARVAAAVDLLWSMFRGPSFSAWLELVVAARNDADLRPRVADVNRAFVARVVATFLELFPPPDGALSPSHVTGLALLFAILQGLALQQLVDGGPDVTAAALAAVKELAHVFVPG